MRLSKARLDELVEEAIVEDNLSFPFATTVLGVPVTVERVQREHPYDDEFIDGGFLRYRYRGCSSMACRAVSFRAR